MGANGIWNNQVTAGDRGYEIGNPEAEVTLTEFVSYTCPHCATFAIQGEAPLQIAYIGTGKLKLDVRSIIRNDLDLAVTMLTQCGDPAKFMRNHTYFMTSQKTWLSKAQNATRAQVMRWTTGDGSVARRAIATDLGFYQMMETRGYSRINVDKCLGDNAKANDLRANTKADFEEFGIRGTPSFAINGETLENVHSWRALEQQLNTLF